MVVNLRPPDLYGTVLETRISKMSMKKDFTSVNDITFAAMERGRCFGKYLERTLCAGYGRAADRGDQEIFSNTARTESPCSVKERLIPESVLSPSGREPLSHLTKR